MGEGFWERTRGWVGRDRAFNSDPGADPGEDPEVDNYFWIVPILEFWSKQKNLVA